MIGGDGNLLFGGAPQSALPGCAAFGAKAGGAVSGGARYRPLPLRDWAGVSGTPDMAVKGKVLAAEVLRRGLAEDAVRGESPSSSIWHTPSG